ncbi:apoptosis-associated speck-like protein containing a CARD [Leptodactylus fuscus]|uniref:apoptosis-associated speck-like protein containing a CARD n=1 Tax=Leptodactylus fuscus TaxID=238119 RepID=UPI003F4E6DCA
MEKTVRDVLVQGLENLGKRSFKKFKNKLNDLAIREGFSKIPRGKLEEADTEDVADLIRGYYKDSYGAEMTLTVLEAIDERQEAEKLRNDLKTVVPIASAGAGSREDRGVMSGGPLGSVLQAAGGLIQGSLVEDRVSGLVWVLGCSFMGWWALRAAQHLSSQQQKCPKEKTVVRWLGLRVG